MRYDDARSQRDVHTANELHLPVGVPVQISLQSADVIHSLWIPNLAGKQDLIPGRVNEHRICCRSTPASTAASAPNFAGCSMPIWRSTSPSRPPADFARWRDAAARPAAAAGHARWRSAGYDYVTDAAPASPATISPARPPPARSAPDLSHVASRRSIGAGTLPMTPGHLAGWVADPQGLKPGNNMPIIAARAGPSSHAIAAYLETLR